MQSKRIFRLTMSISPPITTEMLPTNAPASDRRRGRRHRSGGGGGGVDLLHLATAPVSLWQHVLRKSRQSNEHLPRVMPPALRPTEERISHRMRCLLESVGGAEGKGGPTAAATAFVKHLTWHQLFVILNACEFPPQAVSGYFVVLYVI